jgi:FAD/FMN-containing dehydrogenase/enamine deaminase RidA (YjgF/YER057c/UK114 family)
MTTIPAHGPVDDLGRLVHEDDPAAQLALAVARLEATLADAGTSPVDLASLTVHTTDRRALDDVYDVLADRLDVLGARPTVTVVETDRLTVPGMVVALTATTHTHPKEAPMTTTDLSPAESLRGQCGGRVYLPGDPGYDAARTAWNLAADQRPAAVAVPHSIEEVVGIVRAAVAAKLRVAPQTTGHGAAPLAAQRLDDVVVVRLADLTGVQVDAESRTARVAGGTQWAAVIAATAEHGLTALHGSAPDVGVAGYLLGGGLSFYGRRHGLAANSLLAVEIVTASGALVRASADQNPDLFWAVRSGGGNVGIVVAMEIALLPYADVYAGMLLWDRERAPEVVRAWAAWTRTTPDSVTTSLRVMSFPPLPELPPFLSGRQLVIVDGAVLEDDDRAAELLAPLRALSPEMDTFGRIPAAGLLAVHMDPPAPTAAVGSDALLGELDDDAITALLDFTGPGTTNALMFTEIRQLGGALADREAGPATVAAPYLLHGIAATPFPEAVAAGRADTERLLEVMAPWTVPGRLLTFVDRSIPPRAAYGDRVDRLREIRAMLDPAGTMVGNHPID